MRQVDDADDAAASIASRGVGRAELFVTVFIVGAMIMAIEVVGTRIVGPVFGVGLFVWSALLAVTLGALALGYYSGGVLADRIVSARLLGTVVTGAGVLLSLVPLRRGHCRREPRSEIPALGSFDPWCRVRA